MIKYLSLIFFLFLLSCIENSDIKEVKNTPVNVNTFEIEVTSQLFDDLVKLTPYRHSLLVRNFKESEDSFNKG